MTVDNQSISTRTGKNSRADRSLSFVTTGAGSCLVDTPRHPDAPRVPPLRRFTCQLCGRTVHRRGGNARYCLACNPPIRRHNGYLTNPKETP